MIEWIDMNEFKWMNWNEWSVMNELKWMNWNEWVEMNELTWMIWNERTEMNELKRINWQKELKWMNWSKWIDMNELKWTEMNELTWVNWNESIDMNDLPKVARNPQFFLRFLCEAELSLQSLAHFADLIFQKCSEPLSFLTFFKWKSSSRYSPAHILSTTFPDRAAHPQKQRPRQPLYRKKYRVSRPRVSSSLNSRVPDPNTSQLLAWWCGCHDDWGDDAVAIMMRKLAMTIVRNSEVS